MHLSKDLIGVFMTFFWISCSKLCIYFVCAYFFVDRVCLVARVGYLTPYKLTLARWTTYKCALQRGVW